MENEITLHNNTQTLMQDPNAMEQLSKIATSMAKSSVSVPDHLRGKPNDCLAIAFQAAQWRMSPFVVAQKTFFINGVIGYEAQLVNAAVSSSTAITGRFHYEYKGNDAEWKPSIKKINRNGKDVWVPQFSPQACVRVGAKLKGEVDVTFGEWVYPANQTIFNSPLWRTNPKQQAAYLAVKFWSRLYTPDVLMGVYTPDELQDAKEIKEINPKQKDFGVSTGVMDKLNPKKQSKKTVVIDAEQEFEEDTAFYEWSNAIDITDSSSALNQFKNDIESSNRMNQEIKDRLIAAINEKIEVLNEC